MSSSRGDDDSSVGGSRFEKTGVNARAESLQPARRREFSPMDDKGPIGTRLDPRRRDEWTGLTFLLGEVMASTPEAGSTRPPAGRSSSNTRRVGTRSNGRLGSPRRSPSAGPGLFPPARGPPLGEPGPGVRARPARRLGRGDRPAPQDRPACRGRSPRRGGRRQIPRDGPAEALAKPREGRHLPRRRARLAAAPAPGGPDFVVERDRRVPPGALAEADLGAGGAPDRGQLDRGGEPGPGPLALVADRQGGAVAGVHPACARGPASAWRGGGPGGRAGRCWRRA